MRALAVITPGNPTGQVIPKSNIEQLIKFSKNNDLAVIADEVYQVNVYNSSMHSPMLMTGLMARSLLSI